MQSKEQRLIEGLFQRIQQAEQSAEPRNIEAERQINDCIQKNPAAPYYMVQSLLIQEAALNKLNQQINQLKNEISQLKTTQQPTGKRLLGTLFGNRSQTRTQDQSPMPTANYNGSLPSGPSRCGSFMSGALQTAAGVAGGMVLGNMLNNMFHHTAPEEIVNIIDDSTMGVTGIGDPLLNQNFDAGNLETFNSVSDRHFFDQSEGLSNNEWSDDDFSQDDGFL